MHSRLQGTSRQGVVGAIAAVVGEAILRFCPKQNVRAPADVSYATVITAFPLTCPSPRYLMASPTSLKG